MQLLKKMKKYFEKSHVFKETELIAKTFDNNKIEYIGSSKFKG